MGSGGGGGAGGNARKGRKKSEGGGGAEAPAALPDLNGSERQVAWANQIRDKMINDLDQRIKTAESDVARTSGNSLAQDGHKETLAELKDYKSVLSKVDDAKAFIDTRSENMNYLSRELARTNEVNPGKKQQVSTAFRDSMASQGFSISSFSERFSEKLGEMGLEEW